MLCNPLLSKQHWPVATLPKNLFEYYVEEHYSKTQHEDLVTLNCFDDLSNALNTNEDFATFYENLQKEQPKKKKYFEHLAKKKGGFDARWVQKQFKIASQRKAFKALSDEDKTCIEEEYSMLKTEAYEELKRAEAIRLDCHISDACPKSSILPIKSEEGGSPLANLTDELFVRIMDKLNTIDIFRITLVCKRWKRYVYDNRHALKRAEHSMMTHLLTFPERRDCYMQLRDQELEYKLDFFAWCLIRWYAELSENLETIVLVQSRNILNAYYILQHLPKLKHLQISSILAFHAEDIPQEHLMDLSFPNLESFVFCFLYHARAIWFTHKVLATAPKLKVFKGTISAIDILKLQSHTLSQGRFQNLVALDLYSISGLVLERLANLEDLRLRYLRIDLFVCPSDENKWLRVKAEERASMNRLLKNLNYLEILILEHPVGITRSTFQTLIDHQKSFSYAILWEYSDTHVDIDDDQVDQNSDNHHLEVEHFLAYKDMLLDQDPTFDLSSFVFVPDGCDQSKLFDEAQTGFTILHKDVAYESTHLSELTHPSMRRRLGVDF